MGYDMQEGTVVRWLKNEGSEVKMGEPIAEIETDKAVVEFESYAAGILRKVLVSEGISVAVGQPIAIVGTEDEEIPETAIELPEAPSGDQPVEGVEAVEAPPPPSEVQAPAPAPQVEAPELGRELRASPAARRLASERGVDLTQIQGTGPGGRIVKDDVLKVEATQAVTPAEAPATPEPAAVAPQVGPGEKVPLSRMRQQIAKVTVRSKQQTPHFYITSEIDMTRAIDLRRQINEALKPEGVRVSVNDIILKACVGALKKHPKFNAFFVEDGIQMNEQINVGIAIAEEEGLIVPAILDCANKSLSEVARASTDLIARAKSGTLHPEEYTGGTFSISNLGMFDVTSFAAIIHPPQAAVLAVGRVSKRPVVRDDEIVVRQVMDATLSADHRLVDGAEGAQFLIEIKNLLESPSVLML